MPNYFKFEPFTRVVSIVNFQSANLFLVIQDSDRRDLEAWFFHFKTFPVTYFVILDTVPFRDQSVLARNVSWAALRAGGTLQASTHYESTRRPIGQVELARAVCTGAVKVDARGEEVGNTEDARSDWLVRRMQYCVRLRDDTLCTNPLCVQFEA